MLHLPHQFEPTGLEELGDVAEVEGDDVSCWADGEGSNYKGDFSSVVGDVGDGPESLLVVLRLLVS